jgi:asparagine synthase (glutamine-hydrolysing)
MPGLVGVVTKRPRELAEPELLRMVEALRHEPSYTTGTWIDEALGVYVGWTARKGSPAHAGPTRNDRGDVLILSGEEFSGLERPIDLYEGDPRFAARLNGRFHGLLADRRRGTALLFNDRYGMHRLYYHEARDAVYFAAEVKGILTVRPELRRLDPRGLGELVACGCVLEDRTLFDRVHALPGASAWTFRAGGLAARESYFSPREWEEQPRLDEAAFARGLSACFSRILPRYLSARERVAISLTGGLDTRMIMSFQRFGPGTLPTYTFGGMYRECRDVRVAREVARRCGQSHDVITVGPEFLADFPRYAERTVHITDGAVAVSHAPDLYVNERAGEIAPVRLTGNYGSEVLRGVMAFKPRAPWPGLYQPEVVRQCRAAADCFDALRRVHPVSFAVFRQAPWHHAGLLALEESQLALRSPYLDNELVGMVFQAPPAALAGDAVSWQLIADGDPALARVATDRGLTLGPRRLPSMVAHGVAEASRKAEYVYDYGMPRWVARVDHALRRLHLERLFLGRHKFSHFRVWYRDALRDYVRAVLLDPRTLARPYLERRGVEAIVRGHLRGDRNHVTEIHRLLTLELTHRLLVDR